MSRTIFKSELPIALIDPNPSNPRGECDEVELSHLAESVQTHGLLQPVVVRPMKGGRYQLIAGGRRLSAAKAANWESVPATVCKATEGESLTLALVENLERQDLNPIETANAVARLCAPAAEGGCGLSQVDAAAKVSRDVSWIRRQIQLLKLPDIWRRRVASGEINAGMSQTLVPYADRPAVLARVEEDMIANPWAWRTTEDFERNVKLLAEEAPSKRQPAVSAELNPIRATPGTGLRKREPRPRRAATATADDAGPAQPNADDTADAITAEPAPDAVVPQIVAAIARIDDLAALDQISQAVQDRRVAIGETVRQPFTARPSAD